MVGGKVQCPVSLPDIRLGPQQLKSSQKQISKSLGIVQFRLISLLCPIFYFRHCSWSVTRQNGESQNEFFQKKNKARQIFRKTNISHPLIRTYVCVSRGKKCSFFGKFGVLCFFETPVLRLVILLFYLELLVNSCYLLINSFQLQFE